MDYHDDLGFGMFGWGDGDIGIFGGIRSGGYQKAGQSRSTFMIYDTEHRTRTGKDKKVGTVELIVGYSPAPKQAPPILQLVSIEIDKEFRMQGYARRAVEAVMRIAESDIIIADIKKSKLSFWKKMGVVDVSSNGRQLNGTMPKDFTGGPSRDTITSMAI